jgi:hypothetical protein
MKPGFNSSDKGAALLTALMITALVGALTAALVFVVVTENRVSANHQAAQVGAYAAVAAVERTFGELRRLATWELVPDTSGPSAPEDFNDGASAARLPDGTVLDLARLTSKRQADSNAFYPGGADRPVWRLYAHASLARMIPTVDGSARPYVIVWVADDPDDTDGNPFRDSNDTMLVRAEAFGMRGGWRAIDATIGRQGARDGTAAGVTMISHVAIVTWREAR